MKYHHVFINLINILVVLNMPLSALGATEIIVDDFENYNIGQQLGGQGNWTSSSSVHQTVENGDLDGKMIMSQHFVDAQRAVLAYDYKFHSGLDNSYLQFSGQMTSGSGNNCNSRLDIGDGLGHSVKFGLQNGSGPVSFQFILFIDGVLHKGNTFNLDTWYDVRLEMDWTRYNVSRTGVVTLKYKESGASTWITDTALSNKDITIDPEKIAGNSSRMDGYLLRRGKMDSIKVYYGDPIGATATPTVDILATYTHSPTGTFTTTVTPIGSNTATPTNTPTPTITPTATISPTPTNSPTLLPTPMPHQQLKALNNRINPNKSEYTIIQWFQPNASWVKIKVLNVNGEVVKTLVNDHYLQSSEKHEMIWRGTNEKGEVVGSGIYIVHLQAGEYTDWVKVAVIQ